MNETKTAIAVLGNVTLDIICKIVDDVPRHDSISFQEAAVTPGGCGSNTAIGLAKEGEKVYLVACTGDDLTADLLHQTWEKTGVDTHFTKRFTDQGSGVSVGLVDSDFQPRFIHTTGANKNLRPESVQPEKLKEHRVGIIHVAGFFVLPGLLDAGFEHKLRLLQEKEIFVSLDVVTSPAMDKPEHLWPLLPFLNLFLCNLREAEILTGHCDPESASGVLHQKGATAVVIKLGSMGCWLSESGLGKLIPAPPIKQVVDTTGAGDAFAAGLLAALRKGEDLDDACRAGIYLASKTVQYLGAVNISS